MKASSRKFERVELPKEFLIFFVTLLLWSGFANAAEPCANLTGKFLGPLDEKTKALLEVRQEGCSFEFVKATIIDEQGVAKAQCPMTLILDDKIRKVTDDITGALKIDRVSLSGLGNTTYAGINLILDTQAKLDAKGNLVFDLTAKSGIGIVLKRVHLVGIRQSRKFVSPQFEKRSQCSAPDDFSLLELLLFN